MTNNLIILYNLQRNAKYDRSLAKIEMYTGKEMDLHTAISMAVKSSAQIIDDDFDDVIRREFQENSSNNEVTDSDED